MKKQLVARLLGAGLACTVMGSTAMASGNPDEGKKKYYTCIGCHGVVGYNNSYPSYHVPRIGGQHPAYVVSALKEYRNGDRPHPSMQGNAYNLTDQDIENIAAYVSKFRGMNASLPITGNVAAGREKSQTCAGCHGEDGNSSDASYPRLAGQYENYLEHALKDYKSGARKNSLMKSFASNLSEQDMKDLAAYYASQKKGLTLAED